MEELGKCYAKVVSEHKAILEEFKNKAKKCEFSSKNKFDHVYYQYVCSNQDNRACVCDFTMCPIIIKYSK